MRSIEQRLQRLVCAEYCRYYKPWATPEPDCGSIQWVTDLVTHDRGALESIERLRGTRPTLPLPHDRVLLRRVCTRCDHYPYACAYRKPDRSTQAEPCGGLIVLDLLLGRKVITSEALFEAPWLSVRRPS